MSPHPSLTLAPQPRAAPCASEGTHTAPRPAAAAPAPACPSARARACLRPRGPRRAWLWRSPRRAGSCGGHVGTGPEPPMTVSEPRRAGCCRHPYLFLREPLPGPSLRAPAPPPVPGGPSVASCAAPRCSSSSQRRAPRRSSSRSSFSCRRCSFTIPFSSRSFSRLVVRGSAGTRVRRPAAQEPPPRVPDPPQARPQNHSYSAGSTRSFFRGLLPGPGPNCCKSHRTG